MHGNYNFQVKLVQIHLLLHWTVRLDIILWPMQLVVGFVPVAISVHLQTSYLKYVLRVIILHPKVRHAYSVAEDMLVQKVVQVKE